MNLKNILIFTVAVNIMAFAAPNQNTNPKINPLKISNLSSPRSTMESFLHYTRRAYNLINQGQISNQNSSTFFATKEAKQLGKDAEIVFQRAAHCLDFSHVPTAFLESKGYEKTLKLKEILDRIELPPLSEIPDAKMIEEERENKKFPKLHRWRIPKTDIVIARVEEGPRSGEFLFSSDSVSKMDSFYRRAKHLPYHSGEFTTSNFFGAYDDSPGRLLPPKWFQWIPQWSTQQVFSQTIWQWIVLALIILLYVLLVILVKRINKPKSDTSNIAKHLHKIITRSFAVVLAVVLYNVIDDNVNITGYVLIFLRYIVSIVWWSLAASIVLVLSFLVADIMIASPYVDSNGIKASYYRAVFGVLGFIAAAIVLIFGLARIGVALTPLLTGVGIGGIAIAMAARPTLESIISSFIIFADKPYEVGQRVNVIGQYGTVEAIGLRSTRIRLLNGQETSIPNEKMAASEIINVERRPYIRRDMNITIPFDTPPAKIRQAIKILHDILAVPKAVLAEIEAEKELRKNKIPGSLPLEKRQMHPNEAINKAKFPPRVFFSDIKSDALNIKIVYWFYPPQYWDYLAHVQDINLAIIDRFNKAGIEFAFPTQTVFLKQDEC